ncbi:MAG: tetratricopeptide repeat protein [Nitrospirota bacterium]
MQLAEQGHPNAQYQLGKYYMGLGNANMRRDLPRAAKWLKQAAEQGQVDAQYSLGVLYQQGEGVIQDFEEASNWIRKAAEKGMTDAMYMLGIIYYTGRGVATDNIQAYVWLNVAAAQGKEEAIRKRNKVMELLSDAEIIEAQRRSRIWKPLVAKDALPEEAQEEQH